MSAPVKGTKACARCDGHGHMQTGYTGTLQYCGECDVCGGSGEAAPTPVPGPVVNEVAEAVAQTKSSTPRPKRCGHCLREFWGASHDCFPPEHWDEPSDVVGRL